MADYCVGCYGEGKAVDGHDMVIVYGQVVAAACRRHELNVDELIANAMAVVGPASDDDWTIVRKTSFDALSASVAAYRGDSPLNVFAGNP